MSAAVSTVDELIRFLDANGIRHHKIAVFDIDGVLRGKYLSRDKLLSACRNGMGFCDVVLGWDSADQLYDNTALSGWHTGYRDAPVELDLGTLRRVPMEEDTILILGHFVGDYAAACPRSLLQRVVDRAREHGFGVEAALEYEFFLFDETPHSVRNKGYRGLKPFTPGMFGYSMIRSGVYHELHHELLDVMAALDCAIEGLHSETGPGVIEAALCHDEATRAADKAGLFKTFSKVVAQRRGLMATFMAKWSDDYPGQSGHAHLSLTNAAGHNVFHDPSASDGISDVMLQFIAGQVRLLPEVLAMVCSTVNAYRRMVPGLWAPTAANWGVENRTTALRAIPAGNSGTRVEYRIGPADANPHLVLAAALATGLYGIEHEMEPPPAIIGSAYDQLDKSVPLPETLIDATRTFEASDACREMFGEQFVEHFAATRYWEDRQARKHVSDWDLARYFEII